MGVVIPDGFALVSWLTTTALDPEPMVWTMGFSHGSAVVVDDIAESARSAWVANLAAETSSIVTLVNVTAKLGPTATGPTFESPGSDAGTDGGALPPPNTCVLVKKLTGQGGRANRGRAYIPGISSFSGSLDSGGNISSGDAGNIQAAVQGIIDDMASDASGPFLARLLHSDASNTPDPITSVVCDTKLATQRRRLRP